MYTWDEAFPSLREKVYKDILAEEELYSLFEKTDRATPSPMGAHYFHARLMSLDDVLIEDLRLSLSEFVCGEILRPAMRSVRFMMADDGDALEPPKVARFKLSPSCGLTTVNALPGMPHGVERDWTRNTVTILWLLYRQEL